MSFANLHHENVTAHGGTNIWENVDKLASRTKINQICIYIKNILERKQEKKQIGAHQIAHE